MPAFPYGLSSSQQEDEEEILNKFLSREEEDIDRAIGGLALGLGGVHGEGGLYDPSAAGLVGRGGAFMQADPLEGLRGQGLSGGSEDEMVKAAGGLTARQFADAFGVEGGDDAENVN